jgi:hypothetical protein
MKQYKINQKKPNEEYSLNIGDRLVLEDSILEGAEIVYAGMPNDNISFIYTDRELFSTRTRGNLFFPNGKKELSVHNKNLEVLSASSVKISLKYIGSTED